MRSVIFIGWLMRVGGDGMLGGNYPSGGLSLCQFVLCSYAAAICRITSSPNGFPSSCKPIGNFGDFVNPQGTLMPHTPARFAEIVKISVRYICSGSSAFSPISNAAPGQTGATTASTC